VLMEWFEWMWRVALSLACTEVRPSDAPGAGSLQPKKEMATWCRGASGRGGGESEVWLYARVL